MSFKRYITEDLLTHMNTSDYCTDTNNKLSACIAMYPCKEKPDDNMLKLIQATFKKEKKTFLYCNESNTYRPINDYDVQAYARQLDGAYTHDAKYRKVADNVFNLIYYITKGCSFLGAYTEDGSRNVDWISSSIIGIDIDHGLGIDQAIARCEQYKILPTFIYPTFSHLKVDDKGNEVERFRMIFVLSKPSTDVKIHSLLIRILMMIFPECDGACKNVCRLWHGTNKGWFIANGELSELQNKTLNVKVLFDAVNQWLITNVDEGERPFFLENTFGKPYKVNIRDNQLAVKIGAQEENIEVEWRDTSIIMPKLRNARQKCREDKAYTNEQSDDSVEEEYAIDYAELEEKCHLYYEAKQGSYWLEEPEIMMLASNLQYCVGGKEQLKQIIKMFPNYYNNDKHDQAYYIHKIETLGSRLSGRWSCSKFCPMFYLGKCKRRGKNILSNITLARNHVNGVISSGNERERENQLLQLRHEILSTDDFTIDNVIKVFPIEASMGKTTTVIEALKEDGGRLRTLLVTKLIEEQARIASDLREALGDSVLVYNGEEKHITMEQVIKATVVIITHERYKILCCNSEQAEIFTRDRNLLIIDEQIELLSCFELTENLIKDMNFLIESTDNQEAVQLFLEIASPLKEQIHQRFSKERCIEWIEKQFIIPSIGEKIDRLLKLVAEATIPEIFFERCMIGNKKMLLKHINNLRYYFNNAAVLANKDALFSANLNVNHLDGFNKKILLDASASFVETYMSEQYDVKPFSRVLNHSNAELKFEITNTTKSWKMKNPDYWQSIKKYVDDHVSQNDRRVIFASKQEVQKFGVRDPDIVTFASSRGKNTWGGYNKAFIVHTQALGAQYYIFQYLYYFPEEAHKIIGNQEAIAFKKVTGTNWSFANNVRLHRLRCTDIASNFYQAVKRIDRFSNNTMQGVQYHILCNNREVVELVVEQLAGLGKYIEAVGNCSKVGKRKKVKILEDSQRIHDVLAAIPNGKYSKTYIRDICGISDTKTWTRALGCLKAEKGDDILNILGVSDSKFHYEIHR